MIRNLLSSSRIQNQDANHPAEITLKTKIIWTLIFKVVVVLSLLCVFKTYKQIVSSQDVAQKLLTKEAVAGIEEL